MENKVFSWAKKLTEIWYLLITGKFLFWTFRWWEIRSFFESRSWWKDDIYWLLRSSCFELFDDGKYGLFSLKKVDGKMIFTWSFWAFYDIPAPGKYVLLRGVNYIIYFCKLKVRSMESAETSSSNFSETINRGVFRTLSSKEDRALCKSI